LPEAEEASAPSFQHVAAADIPQQAIEGATVRVVVGTAHGATSPVRTLSEVLVLVYDMDVASGTEVEVPPLAAELALYAVDHPVEIDGEKVDEFRLAPLEPGRTHRLAAPRGGRIVLVGGEPLGHRHLAWNFVSSSLERIRAAEADWRAQRFPQVPGETDFIPLPERPKAPTFVAPN
jgi:redox-sensitive bicupin YhaK (pirin superfamily)